MPKKTSSDNNGRRKHKRFKAKDVSFVAPVRDNSMEGQIIDISMGGLSFRYIDSNDNPEEPREIRISYNGTEFQFDNLPVKTVSDIALLNESLVSYIKMRRHSVEFQQMSQEQLSKLEHFLENYTEGCLEDRRNGSDRRIGKDRRCHADNQFLLANRRKIKDKDRRKGKDRRKK